MTTFLDKLGEITNAISSFVWPIFVPLLVILSTYIAFKTFTKFKATVEHGEKLSVRKMIGPASISLGAKIGTGSIIGVLGSLNKLADNGQGFVEAIAIWGLIGAAILIPLTYSETLISRKLDKTPVEYIAKFLTPKLASFYAIALVILYIFGFGGFQFNGIDTVVTIVASKLFSFELSEMQRYLGIIIPVILIASGIIISKKHNLFINSLSGMIGFAVLSYFIFFFFFLFTPADPVELYLSRALSGMSNPVTMGIGIPIGFIFGLQRIIQTSEAGLGTSPLASVEGKEMGARNSALTQVIPTAITVVVSLVITSYVTSYGLEHGFVHLPGNGIERLTGFFNTAEAVTGSFGLIVMSVFAILSGITTLLGSYYFLSQLFIKNKENYNIVVYMILIFTAGTLAVFGFNIIFDVVDILLFAVAGLNILALVMILRNFSKSLKEKAL